MSEPAEQPEPTADATTEGEPQPEVRTDWKAEARKWEQRAKENSAKLKEAAPQLAELQQIKAASQTEAERQAEELTRWQSESQRWQQVAVGSRIQALAADFADPTDAVSALPDPSKYLGAGGDIDDEAIRTDLADVLNRKPHWRKPDGAPTPPRLPAPNLAQGSGGGRPAADPASAFAAIIQGQLNRS